MGETMRHANLNEQATRSSVIAVIWSYSTALSAELLLLPLPYACALGPLCASHFSAFLFVHDSFPLPLPIRPMGPFVLSVALAPPATWLLYPGYLTTCSCVPVYLYPGAPLYPSTPPVREYGRVCTYDGCTSSRCALCPRTRTMSA